MKDLHACVYVCLYVCICIYKRYFVGKNPTPTEKKPKNTPKTKPKNPYLTTPTYTQYAKKKIKKLPLKIIKQEMKKLIRKFKEQ